MFSDYVFDSTVGMYYNEKENRFISDEEYKSLGLTKCECGKFIHLDEVCWCKS